MFDVQTELVINAPIEKVSDYASNPDNAPVWYVNIKSAEWQTPKPLGVGSKIAFTAHFLGKKLKYTYEIVEFIPKQNLIMKTAEGPFPMETSYAWESLGPGKTLMKLRNRGTPTGFSRFLAPLMARAMQSANQKDLRRIKHLLEK